MDGNTSDRPAKARWFLAVGLLLLLTIAVVLVLWLMPSDRVVATALFEVTSSSPGIFSDSACPVRRAGLRYSKEDSDC